MQIRGHVAIVTGASNGIGRECARLLREKGARVALSGREERRLAETAGPDDLVVAGDLTQPDCRRELIERARDRFGRVDLLVNNAGVGLYGPTAESDPRDVAALFDLNLFAPIDLVRLVTPVMRAGGGGVIANISSIAGQMTLPWMTTYSASKAALNAYSDGLRMELASSNIRVVSICPGYVQTDFQKHVLRGTTAERIRKARRAAISADECAQAIVRAVERESRMVATPRVGWLLVWAYRLLPGVVQGRMAAMLSAPEDVA